MSPVAAQYLTVAGYLLAAAAWWIGGLRLRQLDEHRLATRVEHLHWLTRVTWAGTICLLVAGADRYFWISHSFADAVRALAHDQGWYAQRRGPQAVLAVAVVIAVGVLWWGTTLRRQQSRRQLMTVPLATLATLISFCIVRALSQHHIDQWMVFTVAGLRLHWVIEWMLLAMLIGSIGRGR